MKRAAAACKRRQYCDKRDTQDAEYRSKSWQLLQAVLLFGLPYAWCVNELSDCGE